MILSSLNHIMNKRGWVKFAYLGTSCWGSVPKEPTSNLHSSLHIWWNFWRKILTKTDDEPLTSHDRWLMMYVSNVQAALFIPWRWKNFEKKQVRQVFCINLLSLHREKKQEKRNGRWLIERQLLSVWVEWNWVHRSDRVTHCICIWHVWHVKC